MRNKYKGKYGPIGRSCHSSKDGPRLGRKERERNEDNEKKKERNRDGKKRMQHKNSVNDEAKWQNFNV